MVGLLVVFLAPLLVSFLVMPGPFRFLRNTGVDSRCVQVTSGCAM